MDVRWKVTETHFFLSSSGTHFIQQHENRTRGRKNGKSSTYDKKREDVCCENICFGTSNDASSIAFIICPSPSFVARRKEEKAHRCAMKTKSNSEGKNNQSIIDYKRCSVDEPWLVFKWDFSSAAFFFFCRTLPHIQSSSSQMEKLILEFTCEFLSEFFFSSRCTMKVFSFFLFLRDEKCLSHNFWLVFIAWVCSTLRKDLKVWQTCFSNFLMLLFAPATSKLCTLGQLLMFSIMFTLTWSGTMSDFIMIYNRSEVIIEKNNKLFSSYIVTTAICVQ